MRYLVSVIDQATGTASAAEMSAIDAFNDGLREQGRLVLAAGLAEPRAGAVVDFRGAEPVVTQGALHDSRDYLSGFWILQAPDWEAALEVAARASKACNRRVEVRAFLG